MINVILEVEIDLPGEDMLPLDEAFARGCEAAKRLNVAGVSFVREHAGLTLECRAYPNDTGTAHRFTDDSLAYTWRFQDGFTHVAHLSLEANLETQPQPQPQRKWDWLWWTLVGYIAASAVDLLLFPQRCKAWFPWQP